MPDLTRVPLRILAVAAGSGREVLDHLSIPEAVPTRAARRAGTRLPAWAQDQDHVSPIYVLAQLHGTAARLEPGGARARLAKMRTRRQSMRSGADPEQVWHLKASGSAREELRAADIIISLDANSETALRLVPDLVGDSPIVPAARARAALVAAERLGVVLGQLEQGAAVTTGMIRAWVSTMQRVDPLALPGAEDHVVRTARVVRTLHGDIVAARLVSRVLDLPSWPQADRLRSGLAALRVASDLSLGVLDEADSRTAEVAAGPTRAALAEADVRFAAGDWHGALDLLSIATELLFHRTRHADASRSGLVDDPRSYLAGISSSTAWRALLRPQDAGAERRGRTALTSNRPPRVLVVTGAYGKFHEPVVKALAARADVEVVDLAEVAPDLAGKLLDPAALTAVADLVAGALGENERRVRAALEGFDVIFCDWADRATVWLSYQCPPEIPLVVRVHAIDLLDPWFHLVRWERVERVLTVSEPMRSLTVDLLGTWGHRTPVVVAPNMVPTPETTVDKEPGARSTLGMVAWGRRVKDPAWALDLLERDPSWRLVLIGPDFATRPVPSQAAYIEAFRRRLEDPAVRDRVEVLGHTDDVPGALRRVGVLLSASLREGMPHGVLEGAVTGAVPVVRDWPLLRSRGGARSVFPEEWVVADLDEAEARLREVTGPEQWPQHSARARELAAKAFDSQRAAAVYQSWVIDGSEPR